MEHGGLIECKGILEYENMKIRKGISLFLNTEFNNNILILCFNSNILYSQDCICEWISVSWDRIRNTIPSFSNWKLTDFLLFINKTVS